MSKSERVLNIADQVLNPSDAANVLRLLEMQLDQVLARQSTENASWDEVMDIDTEDRTYHFSAITKQPLREVVPFLVDKDGNIQYLLSGDFRPYINQPIAESTDLLQEFRLSRLPLPELELTYGFQVVLKGGATEIIYLDSFSPIGRHENYDRLPDSKDLELEEAKMLGDYVIFAVDALKKWMGHPGSIVDWNKSFTIEFPWDSDVTMMPRDVLSVVNISIQRIKALNQVFSNAGRRDLMIIKPIMAIEDFNSRYLPSEIANGGSKEVETLLEKLK